MEWDGHRVSVFSPSGERLQSFGTQGSGQGQFKDPCGVTVDGKECILVIDRRNHRIQKFTAEGGFLIAVGTAGSGPLHRIPSNDKVYVGDANHHIQIPEL